MTAKALPRKPLLMEPVRTDIFFAFFSLVDRTKMVLRHEFYNGVSFISAMQEKRAGSLRSDPPLTSVMS
jgi:hypothetical protein